MPRPTFLLLPLPPLSPMKSLSIPPNLPSMLPINFPKQTQPYLRKNPAEEEEISLTSGTFSDRPSSSGRNFRNDNRSDLSEFGSPEEFLVHLEEQIESRSLRAMLMFRTALEQEGAPLITVQTVNLMLPVMARSGWFQTVKDTLAMCDERNFRLSTIIYNCALFAMTRTGDLWAMKDVLSKMSHLGQTSRPNATSFNLIIAAHFYQGSVDDAFAVLQDMKSANIYPTIATYQTLVSGCLRRRDYDRAYSALIAIEQQGMSVSAMTVAQMLFYTAQTDRHDQTIYLLNRLEKIIPRYAQDIERIALKRSSLSRSNKLVHESERGEPRLELSLLAALMHSAYRGARPDIAVRAVKLMQEFYPELSLTSDHWYSLIGSLAAVGDFKAAFDALGHMNAAGVKSELRDLMNPLIKPLSEDVAKIDEIYYYLVEGIEGTEQGIAPAMEAEVAVDEQKPKITPDEETETNSIDAELENATAVDLVESAEAHTEAGSDALKHVSLSEAIGFSSTDIGGAEMEEFALPWANTARADVTMSELNCIITACSLAGDIDRAFQTYDEACGRLGFTRDRETLIGLLEGCVQTRHIRGGLRVLEEARSAGTLFNTDTLLMATRLYCRAGRGAEALELLKEGMENGANISVRSWQMLARSLTRSGLNDEADECVTLGVKSGYRENAISPIGFMKHGKTYRNSRGDFSRQESEMHVPEDAILELVDMESELQSTDAGTSGESSGEFNAGNSSTDSTNVKMDS